MTLLAMTWLAACGPFGTVEQGRAVAYDPATGALTVVLDVGAANLPEYAGAVTTWTLPADPHHRGPEPVPGALVAVDVGPDGATLALFEGGGVRHVALRETAVAEGVDARDPRVWDKAGKRATVPRVEPGGAVTVWDEHHERLVTGTPDRPLAEDALGFGDEVRVYLAGEPPVVERFMNVTRTHIFEK